MSEGDDGLLERCCFSPRLCFPSSPEIFSYSGTEFTEQNYLEPLLWTGCCPSRWEQRVPASHVLAYYPQWVTTKGGVWATLWAPVVGQAALQHVCSPLISLSVRSVQCTVRSVKGVATAFCAAPSLFVSASCCYVCASALLGVHFVELDGLPHVLSVSDFDFWVI